MAIIFDPINKIIQLDSFTVSAGELWTAMVDWSVLGDNLKYGEGMLQVGGVAPVALYIYLGLDWKIRPKEANGTTTITGNILTSDASHPVTTTVGNWQALVNMETPVQAVGINTDAQDLTGLASAVWNYTQ